MMSTSPRNGKPQPPGSIDGSAAAAWSHGPRVATTTVTPTAKPPQCTLMTRPVIQQERKQTEQRQPEVDLHPEPDEENVGQGRPERPTRAHRDCGGEVHHPYRECVVRGPYVGRRRPCATGSTTA